MDKPRVSIIIPAYNEEKTLEACLDSMMQLDYPPTEREILVVDDGSTDATRDIVMEYEVNLLTAAHAGPSSARNIGIAHAAGDYIAFTDADCRVHPQWLNKLVTVLEANPEAAAVGGSQQAVPTDPALALATQKFLEMLGFLGGYTKGHRSLTAVEHNASCNAIYRKRCLMEIGGFLPGLFPGEDVELDYRMRKSGYHILYEPEAVVFHQRPRTFGAFFKMIFGYGKGSGGFLLRRYGLMRPFQLLFPLFVLLFAADVALMLGNVLLFTLFHAGLALSLFVYVLLKTRDFYQTVTVCILFVITLVAWNAGFVRGLFWTAPARTAHTFTEVT